MSDETPRWSVFAPTDTVVPDEPAIAQLASALFSVELSVVSRAVDGAFTLSVRPRADGPAQLVRCQSLAIADARELHAKAEATVHAMGGAGMDVLLARAKRVWTWAARALPDDAIARRDPRAYERAAAMVAGVLAQHALGPARLPDGSKLVGIRGVRAWLERADS